MYGGRVSNSRRVLKTYLEGIWATSCSTTAKITFSKVGFDCKLPEWGDLENYAHMVESLP